MTDFYSMFLASNGKPISVDGRLVHLAYRRPISKGWHGHIVFESSSQGPVQGLRLTLKRGRLRVADTEGQQIVLWRDTAPTEVPLTVSSAPRGAELVVVNVWRDAKHGTTMQGVNNAGMLVELHDDGVRLRCSDGWGPADFTDLVVRLVGAL
jgi:hypothetical protein